jgi:hypothetical protein
MNRFHLLSFEEEETSAPVAPIEHTKSTASSGSVAKKSGKEHKGPAKMDRHSRSGRKGEGEKHQNVGKGSWGRATDSALPEEERNVADEAIEGETAEVPKPAYKTVSQFLAEQEELQKRLSSRSQLNVRRANEGVEIDDMEVIRKGEQNLVIGKNPQAKKSAASPKEPVKKTLSLQELNKILPPAERRSHENKESRKEPREDKESREGRPRQDRSKQDGNRRPQHADNDRRPRQDKDRRPQQNEERRGNNNGQFKPAKIDFADKNAFPSLA